MSDRKETPCRLCLKNITDESFEVVDNIIRDILDVLLLKLKFDSESKEVICKVCRRKLNKASEFKSTCLNTDYTIIPYVDNEKMLQLDLREVYKQEKDSELVCSQKICRLCMHPVETEYRCIGDVELEAIEKLVPEMNINIIKDPVVCKQCFDSLCTHNSFLKDCSEVEERKSIFGSSATGSRIDTSPLDLLVKTENLDKEFDINEMDMSIKPEYVDIKSEDEERSDPPLQSYNIVPFEESDCKDEEEDLCKHENVSEVKTKQERKVLYKCESCEYETENEKLLQRHLLRHKDPLQIQIRKLNAALEFKSTCLNTDNTIIPYVDSEKMLQLDLREVYMQEKKSELVCSHKICRLCMHPVENEFRCVHEVELEAIEKLAPEMNINIIKDPVVCKPCFDCLCTHNSFLKDCSEVEEKIKSTLDSSARGSQIDMCSLDVFVKTENLDKEFDINEMEMSIKAESIDIKSEDEERSGTPLESSTIVPFEESDCKDEDEDGCKHENASEVKAKQARKVLYKCDECIYETRSEIRFTIHCARHKNNLEAYKCESCEYETENEKLLQRHLLRHKDPSQVQIDTPLQSSDVVRFKEGDCKDAVDDGCKHENRSETKTKQEHDVLYKCDKRIYETRSKIRFATHCVRHEDDLEEYKCERCEYVTENERLLQRHQLRHIDCCDTPLQSSNIVPFEESDCKDEEEDGLKHENASEVKTKQQRKVLYKCDECIYETESESSFMEHCARHENDLEKYKCQSCEYETENEKLLQRHLRLRHKDPLQTQKYKCKDCDFKTKYKSSIKLHQLMHKDPSQPWNNGDVISSISILFLTNHKRQQCHRII
ncbi:zinc finger protein 624-like [Anoplophora glabripennis]|uniref:zinc finger protein 624-like n=1 Tax=Anoplophora glabripennis TaxID=217634 RepID=UPI000C773F71|nr:zinc finger protein 624-like [Anoplophora glabripennis]